MIESFKEYAVKMYGNREDNIGNLARKFSKDRKFPDFMPNTYQTFTFPDVAALNGKNQYEAYMFKRGYSHDEIKTFRVMFSSYVDAVKDYYGEMNDYDVPILRMNDENKTLLFM